MQAIGKLIMGLLQNKWFWIVLGAIVLFFIARRHWWKIKRTFQPKDIDVEKGEQGGIPSYRKERIEEIAEELRNDIFDTPYTGHNYTPYEMSLDLSDQELNFLARYYQKQLSEKGNSLYEDIGSQSYVFGSSPGELKTRLSKIGMK